MLRLADHVKADDVVPKKTAVEAAAWRGEPMARTIQSHEFLTPLGTFTVEFFAGHADDLPYHQEGWSATPGLLPGEACAVRILARGGLAEGLDRPQHDVRGGLRGHGAA